MIEGQVQPLLARVLVAPLATIGPIHARAQSGDQISMCIVASVSEGARD